MSFVFFKFHKCGGGGYDQAAEELRHVPVQVELWHFKVCSDKLQHIAPDNAEQPQGDEEVVYEGENKDNIGVKTNLFGVSYIMRFEIGIDIWIRDIQYSFSDKNFEKYIEDYFALFADKCRLQSN